MKNNNGFTLTELLATIVIIALLGGIGALAYSGILKSSQDRVYESYENTMHAEIIQYLSKNVGKLPKNNQTKKFYTTAGSGRETFPIEEINNPREKTDKCTNSYVEVKRTNVGAVESFTYKVCLICNAYNSDGSKCKTFEN